MEINCLHFDVLDSTNTWSKENFNSFDPKKITLVTSSQQTAGRGRYKRPWISPPGQNIYATFTLFLEKTRTDIANLSQIAALSVVHTLEASGFNPFLKWPNDILIHKKKVAGILCETLMKDNLLVVIIGIGININMPSETCATIDQPATSLKVESGKEFSIASILQSLQKCFLNDIERFIEEGFSIFLNDYTKHLIHKKGDHLVLNGVRGTFQTIDKDGALIMQLEDGGEKKFFSGEIEIKDLRDEKDLNDLK